MERRFTRSRDDDYVKLNTRRLPLRSGVSAVAVAGSQQGCNGESTLLAMHDATTFATWLATRKATSEATRFATRLAQAKHFAGCLAECFAFIAWLSRGTRATIGEI